MERITIECMRSIEIDGANNKKPTSTGWIHVSELFRMAKIPFEMKRTENENRGKINWENVPEQCHIFECEKAYNKAQNVTQVKMSTHTYTMQS